ncbi:MAG: ribose 5-phosphate isomerase B [Clostridia bacterium]|nr:ribose 5-phosphate isomerase B [Clostridia bacterium]
MKTIVLGADHGGFELKNIIKAHLENSGFTVIDVGTNSADSCDYPIFASRLCKKIQVGEAELGILVCGTGIGMSMAANKHKGIRAACCSDTFSARLTRLHNDANVLCLGARVLGAGLALDLVNEFVNAEFEGDRHIKRLSLIEDIENGKLVE